MMTGKPYGPSPNTVTLGMIYPSAKNRNLPTAFLWQGHHG